MTAFRMRRRRGASRPAAGDLVRAIGRRTGGGAWRLVLTVAVAAVAGTVGVLAAGPGPAAPALATGALTWLALTVRRNHGPPG